MRKAFTLIELLVVIAIIAAILFPVFAQAKAAAKPSVNIKHLKQIGLAGMMYAAEADDNMVANSPDLAFNGKAVSNGSWYWLFRFQPYSKGKPANFNGTKSNVFFSPLAPDNTAKQFLSEKAKDPRVTYLGAQGLDKEWGLTRTTDPAGNVASSYLSTYSINEQLCHETPSMTAWQWPAESFMILEASDSEIEEDEVDEIYSRTMTCAEGGAIGKGNGRPSQGGHNAGLTYTYLDGRTKWKKTGWTNASNQCQVKTATESVTGESGSVLDPKFPESGYGGANTRIKGWTSSF